MPNPLQSDLHVNVPLTNVSVAWMQSEDAYIADKVFPRVPVEKQSDYYWKYIKGDWRRTDVQKRAPGTETPGTGWRQAMDSYFAHVYGVHHDIDDQRRANADSVFKIDSEATKFVTNQLLLKRDLDWSSTYFTTSVWGSDKTGVASNPSTNQFLQWNDASSTPIEDMDAFILSFRETTGFKPNVLVMGPAVFSALKNHADILERIKYTQRGLITEDLIASMFGVDRLLINYASHNQDSANDNLRQNAATDDAVDFTFTHNSKACLLAYSPSSPSLMSPAAGYTFTWRGYLGGNDRGIKIKKFRQEATASDRVEGEMTYDMKVVAPEMGVFLSAAVA